MCGSRATSGFCHHNYTHQGFYDDTVEIHDLELNVFKMFFLLKVNNNSIHTFS